MIEIVTIEDFKKYKATEGYFIITDDANNHKVHSNRCNDVDVANFRMKVLDNTKKHGQYFFTSLFSETMDFPKKTKTCANCRHF